MKNGSYAAKPITERTTRKVRTTHHKLLVTKTSNNTTPKTNKNWKIHTVEQTITQHWKEKWKEQWETQKTTHSICANLGKKN